MAIEVIPLERFRREYKRLRKKYQRLQETVQALVEQLQAGELPGELLQDVREKTIYKVRLPNKDAGKGKSGGFRLIYYVWTEEGILLLSIYAKSDRENLTSAEIRQMIDDLGQEDTPPASPLD